jgi:hypothetical protein
MTCGGSHLGFPIGIKNSKFVEDLPMIILGQFFFSETTNMIKAKLYMNVHWVVLCKLKVFCSDMKFKLKRKKEMATILKLAIKNIYPTGYSIRLF